MIRLCDVCHKTRLHKDNKTGVCKRYKTCLSEWHKRRWANMTENEREAYRANERRQRDKQFISVLVSNTKQRAKKDSLPFDLTVATVPLLPTNCPCCGSELIRGGSWHNQPSLDRVIPSLGYVATNVQWLCRKCNLVKSNSSLTELRNMVAFLERSQLWDRAYSAWTLKRPLT